MNRSCLKKVATLFLGGLALMFAAASHADDTEVYLDSGSAYASPPIVMFYMEYTQSLASTVCASNAMLTDGSNITSVCPDLAPLAQYFVYPTSTGASTSNNDFIDQKIDEFELVRAALKRVLIGLKKVKVGIVMAHNDTTTGTCKADTTAPYAFTANCSNGAYILQNALTFSSQSLNDIVTSAGYSAPFDPTNTNHRAAVLAFDAAKRALFTKLNEIPSPQGNLSHANQNKEVYFELFRYFAGKPVYNGHNGWDDFATSNVKNLGSNADSFTYKPAGGLSFNLDTTNLGWDITAESSNVYVSPINKPCQKLFVINVVDGSGNAADNSDVAITPSFANNGMNMTLANGDSGFVQIVGKMHDMDFANASTATSSDLVVNPSLDFADTQNVTSFFVSNHPTQTNAAAMAGGTNQSYQLSGDPNSVINALESVFDQILSVSTTFVSASIPVNVFNRSEVIDNAYIALFQANADSTPRWTGDVKKLKLSIFTSCTDPTNSATCTNSLHFIDANLVDAIATDGRIKSSALTYWTNKLGYDISDTPNPSVTGNDPPPEATLSDGRAVMRGGSGQKIPAFLASTVNAAGVYPQGTATWYSAASGARRLYTDADTTAGDPVYLTNSKLMSIEWANVSYLWPIIRDKNDPYSVSLWPSNLVDYTTGAVTPYDGVYADDNNLEWPSGCYSYWPSSSTSASSTYYGSGICWVGDIASNVIAYMRGYDVNSIKATTLNSDSRLLTRRWTMDDPLHSRPLPINYGARTGYSTSNPDIRILVGSNDGYMRMLKNTDQGTTSGAELGTEVWAYMPREVMKKQKQMMDDLPVGSSSTLPRHPYGVDGAPVSYIKDSDGTIDSTQGDEALLFFGLRRGGRGYYALDITDPDNPMFKWKITNATPNFTELGYTFSQPVVREMKWDNSATSNTTVLIFGGGYDLNKDVTGVGTNDSMGNAIYIVDAHTGALIWKVVGGTGVNTATTYYDPDMVDSIPSSVAAIDDNNDGLVDRIYVGDTGGRVWRIDTPYSATTSGDQRTNWKSTVLMNLGRHDATSYNSSLPESNDRRFFYPPDVVTAGDATGTYDAVVIGSGNRAHPLGTQNLDYMFMYKDRYSATASYSPTTVADLADLTSNCMQGGTCSTATLDALATTGWKMELPGTGEKSLSAPLTIQGVIYFSTYLPTTTLTTTCQPEGYGYFYAVSLTDATAVFNFSTANDTSGTPVLDRSRQLASGGIASDPVFITFRQGDKKITTVLPSDLTAMPDLGSQEMRSYWYEKQK